jgi:hypothetical protein
VERLALAPRRRNFFSPIVLVVVLVLDLLIVIAHKEGTALKKRNTTEDVPDAAYSGSGSIPRWLGVANRETNGEL